MLIIENYQSIFMAINCQSKIFLVKMQKNALIKRR